MLFSELKVEPIMIRSGGLEDLLLSLSDEDVQERQRDVSLLNLQVDIELESGCNSDEIDSIAELNTTLLQESLKTLQRINILFSMSSDVGGMAEELRKNETNKYENLKKKFKTIIRPNKDTNGKTNININRLYF